MNQKTTSQTNGNGRRRRRSLPTTGRLQTARRFDVPHPLDVLASREIKQLRVEVLGVSQRIFAGLLNVAVQTVHAWEQGGRKPSGVALRLLHVARERPETLKGLVTSRNGNGHSKVRPSQRSSR
jgi:DNA-binding transcriptional regulator YiaG